MQRIVTLTLILSMLNRPTTGENITYKLSFIKCLLLFLSFFNQKKESWRKFAVPRMLFTNENILCKAVRS